MFTGTTISELMEIADRNLPKDCGMSLTRGSGIGRHAALLGSGSAASSHSSRDGEGLRSNAGSSPAPATNSGCHCGDPLHNSDEHEAVEELGRVEQQYPEFIR